MTDKRRAEELAIEYVEDKNSLGDTDSFYDGFLAGLTEARTGSTSMKAEMEDLVDKLECMVGYCEVWMRGVPMPLELPDVIEEANACLTHRKEKG